MCVDTKEAQSDEVITSRQRQGVFRNSQAIVFLYVASVCRAVHSAVQNTYHVC